jgi:transcriptional regulator
VLYNPPHFKNNDAALCKEVIAAHPFATLISSNDIGLPEATHAPLMWFEDTQGAWLLGHMARANPHHGLMNDGDDVLALFHGPHCYVSPNWYSNIQNVPTWNYVAVHVRGPLFKIDGMAEKDALLKHLIGHMEPAYAEQWRGLPADYQERMLSMIVGFKIRVDQLEGKFKLSQNRQSVDSAGVVNALTAGNEEQRAVAAWMQRFRVGLANA